MAAGVTYVLVANELIVPQPLERVAALARDAAVSVAVDSRSGAETLSAAAVSPGVTLGGVVDVDVGTRTVRRAGLRRSERVASYRRGRAAPSLGRG